MNQSLIGFDPAQLDQSTLQGDSYCVQLIEDPSNLKPYEGAAFVPTMGSLHDGHFLLMRRAKQLADKVVISIFVNPTQFGPDEDYLKYPRTLDADLASIERVGVDAVFMPSVETMYPNGIEASDIKQPDVAIKPQLEDAHRPEHFAGVCQVVAKLFDFVKPCFAIFGEKDYQQLLVITQMVKDYQDRWPGLCIEGHPTAREDDGLAMSSRNAFLSSSQRAIACEVYQRLSWAQHAQAQEKISVAETEKVITNLLQYVGFEVDYAVIRDAETLMSVSTFDQPARALAAVRLGEVRLIDNIAIDAN